MNIIDSAHRTVHAYPGGSESLAPRLGMSPAVLRNKVNPNNTTHHLTMVEADEIMSMTGDHRILHDLAAAHGYTLHKIGAPTASESLLGLVLAVNESQGDFAEVLSDALADNIISENDMRTLANVGNSAQAAMVMLLTKCRAMARERAAGGANA